MKYIYIYKEQERLEWVDKDSLKWNQIPKYGG